MSEALVAILGAGAMATFALGLWVPAYLRHRELQRRLGSFVRAGSDGTLALDLGGRRRMRVARRASNENTPPAIRFINARIARSHADVSVGEVMAAMVVLGILSFVLGTVWWGSLIGGFALLPLAIAAPIWWLDRQHQRQRGLFAGQLLDTLALLASSVRSGHSLLQAFEHVASEAPEPTSSAFALVVREIGVGAGQEDALERLGERFASEDVDLIVSAINVHHQIGGSLSRVLDAIGETVRERQRVAGDIKSITSQQRYSAYVLALLPVITMVALMFISPDYVRTLYDDPQLRIAGITALGLVVSGFFAMRALSSVDV
jgi:tight adherence protein B